MVKGKKPHIPLGTWSMTIRCTKGGWYRFKLSDDLNCSIPCGLNYPGVYIVFNLKNECLYIGQSFNLGSRLRQQIKLSLHSSLWKVSWRKKGYSGLMVAFRIDKKRFERLILEARLIYRLKPKHNLMGKNNNG